MHIGFSGSREGMSTAQFALVRTRLAICPITDVWLHHGLCRGADADAHDIARRLGFKIYGHPALDRSYEVGGLRETCDKLDAPYSYHGRNHRIVLECELLIATPKNNSGTGGTWWTINCARRIGKPRIIIHRDGSVLSEQGN